jgi:hypothetical protein
MNRTLLSPLPDKHGSQPQLLFRFVVGMMLIIGFCSAGAQAQFRLFDNFEDELLGPIDEQDGWDSAGGNNQVVIDPNDAANQVAYVPSSSSTLDKSLLDEDLGVPDGTVRMMFLRLRVENKQTFSLGVSPLTHPREYSDFGPELGMANSSPNLDLRVWDDDGGMYEELTQLDPQRWYNVWILIDAQLNHYEVWLNDNPQAPASAADKLSADDADETFEFRTGDNSSFSTFYIKTSGGSSGQNFGPIYFDDVHFEVTNSLNLSNPTAIPGDCDGSNSIDFQDTQLVDECLTGPVITSELICPCLDIDLDGDVDVVDWAELQILSNS